MLKKLSLGCLLVACIVSLTAAQTPQHRSLTWAAFQKSGPPLKQIGNISVKHAKDIQSSPWSVGCETLDRDFAIFKHYKNYVGKLGVKHARLQSGWAKCEKKKGEYDFAWLDECVYGLHEQGVKPWICLCYGNPIYGSGVHLGAGVAALAHDKEATDAWLKYVEATVARYKDVVNEWEIWNEPYGQEKDYAPLMIATAEVIKRVQPKAVTLGEIAWWKGDKGGVILLEALKTANKLDLIDYWAYHPYINNPDDCYPLVDQLKQLVESYSPKYKLYQGEVGCPSILEWTHALADYPWTEYSQAKWDLRRMAGDRVRNIPSSIFTIVDLRYPNMLQSFGLIRANLLHELIYLRPSYYAVQHMAGFFDDTVVSVGMLEYESTSPRKMTAAGFRKNDKPAILIWYSDQVPSDALTWDTVDLTTKNVVFHDPVFVEMITGRVFEMDKATWKVDGGATKWTELPMWDSPVMIAERELVELRTAEGKQ